MKQYKKVFSTINSDKSFIKVSETKKSKSEIAKTKLLTLFN